MERSEKHAEVELLNDSFKSSQIAFCADYRGLTVAKITALRRELNKANARARVVKNTLVTLAAKKAFSDAQGPELERFLKVFEGPSFVVLADGDPIAPAKVLAKFAKDNDKLSIKGAWFEGAFVDKAGVVSLSTMPGREETFAKLLSLMMAPATQLVRLIKEPSAQLVRTIEAHRVNLEKAA